MKEETDKENPDLAVWRDGVEVMQGKDAMGEKSRIVWERWRAMAAAEVEAEEETSEGRRVEQREMQERERERWCEVVSFL